MSETEKLELGLLKQNVENLCADISEIKGDQKDIKQSITTFIESQHALDKRLVKVEQDRSGMVALVSSIGAWIVVIWRIFKF